jgi:hypothetical protein
VYSIWSFPFSFNLPPFRELSAVPFANCHTASSRIVIRHSNPFVFSNFIRAAWILAVIVTCGSAQGVWASATATTTTLSVSSGGSEVSTVASGSVITLRAAVNAGTVAVTTGQVNFCDASATYCSDIRLLGTAELTSAGVATIKIVPGIGSHSYKAVFVGTNSNSTSSSSAFGLEVTGLYPTTTSIASSGGPGSYALTATVSTAGIFAADDAVSFLDTSNANHSLGTTGLGTETMGLNFLNSSNPATGENPDSLAVGDFNNDGIPDLAVPNNVFGGPITLLLGKEDGTFESTTVVTPPYLAPCRVVAGDFNGDGNLDLAALNCNYVGSVTILLGKGDGTFAQAASSPSTGYGPVSIAVGDFNGDGNLDLVVVNQGSPVVATVLLGNGDATFTATATNSSLPYLPETVQVGDFNGDGKADLVVSCGSDGSLMIFLGNGDGTFSQTPVSPTTGPDPNGVAVGDFNGDGKLDLAVTTGGVFGNDILTVLLGNGDGTFTAAGPGLSVGVEPQGIVVGDFNADGKADLAVPSYGSDTVTVLLGNGDGTFTPATSPATGSSPYGIATTDFNGDGKADLAIVNNASDNVTVLLSQASETAVATIAGISVLGTGTHQIQASYAGDSNNSPSLSSTIGLAAQLGTSTVTVTPSSSSVTTTQAFSVTIAVNGASGNPTPTGTVTLTSGSYTSTASVLASGSAMISIPAGSLAIGAATLTASYSGDGNYAAAIGTASVTVKSPATPTVMVTPSSSSITTIQAFTVTVVVNGASGNPTPTGTVTLTSGSYASSAATLSNGSATIAVPAGSLAIGTNALTVNYSGDGNYTANTGATSVTVRALMSPMVTVTLSSSSITTAQALTVMVAVSGASGNPTPTGTVTLTSGSYASLAATLSNGSATIAVPAGSLAIGTNALTVNYSGDGNYIANIGTAPIMVAAPVNPSITVAGTAVTIPSGATTGNISTISVTPAGGFTGSVALTAAVTSSPAGAQDPPSLSFGSTTPISITGAKAETATLTFSTTAATITALVPADRSGIPWWMTGGATLAGVLCFGVRRRRAWRVMLGVLTILIALTSGVVACGGGGGGGGNSGTSNPGTTPGTYTVTITGTSGPTTSMGTVTLTVQ